MIAMANKTITYNIKYNCNETVYDLIAINLYYNIDTNEINISTHFVFENIIKYYDYLHSMFKSKTRNQQFIEFIKKMSTYNVWLNLIFAPKWKTSLSEEEFYKQVYLHIKEDVYLFCMSFDYTSAECSDLHSNNIITIKQ